MKEKVIGKIVKDRIIVDENLKEALPFYDRSAFGEIKGESSSRRLELSIFESLYLLENNKLVVEKAKKKLSFNSFVNAAEKVQEDFYAKYLIFKDLRSRGYILKTALKFGADFRVYDKGIRPGKDHAKWILYCAKENEKMTWKQFSAMNRVSHSTKKNLLLGIVDAEGDVTYFEIKWKRP